MHNPALERGSPAHLQAVFAHLCLRRCHREVLRPSVRVPCALSVQLLLRVALLKHLDAPHLVADVVHRLAVPLKASVWAVEAPEMESVESAIAAQWHVLNADSRAAIAHLISVAPGAPCVTVTPDVSVSLAAPRVTITCCLCHLLRPLPSLRALCAAGGHQVYRGESCCHDSASVVFPQVV